MSEPRFLTRTEVLHLHHLQLEAFGGSDGIRDDAAFESALGMPQQSFGGEFVHGDVFEMAAAYVFHIAQNQCFVDGNKRTGLHAALMFLALNGHPILHDDDRLYEMIIAFAERRAGKPEMAALLRELSRRPG